MTLGRAASSSSMQKKKLPKKAASSTENRLFAPTFRCSSADVGLQAADKQRKYLRRGSKTPTMLLISAGLDLSLFENRVFHTEETMQGAVPGECPSETNFVAIATQKALAMAAAVDFLSEAKLEEIRTKERSTRFIKESTSSISADDANKDLQEMKMMTKSFHPRRLSAMTALKKNLEKASISPAGLACGDDHLPGTM